MQRKIVINNQIRAERVRLINEKGENLGIFLLKEALNIAQEKGLDLIQITDKTDIPVCKLGEIGKHLYRLKKKEGKKSKKAGELKNIRIGYNISDHDIETKAKQVLSFLKKGNKVRIELRLKGREHLFSEIGKEKITQFLEKLNQEIEIKSERDLKKEPHGWSIIISKK